jgi:hypothetical protein
MLVAYDEDLEIPPDILDAPEELETYGYADRLRPLNGKRLAFPENGAFTIAQLKYWVRRGMNLGLRLHGGLVVVDRDGPEAGPFAELESPMTVQTSRGTHMYFRTDTDHKNRMKIGGLDVDVLFHSVPPLPPSIHPETGWRYRYDGRILERERLPLFPIGILKQFEPPEPVIPPRVPSRTGPLDGLERGRRYIARIVAVEGQGGDRTTFRAACKAVEAADGDYARALQLMLDWNRTNAVPSWEPKDIERKVRHAIRAVFG